MSLNDLGFIPLGTVIPLFWTSHDLATGATETMSGLAVTDIEVYKGTSMTQRSSDSGYALIDTDGLDLDSTTGLNGISIDTGDNTDSGFFAAGSFYNVVVGPVTVDGQTLTIHLATFYLIAAPAVAGVLKTDVTHFGGTAGTFSSGRPEVNTTHAAGTAWGSGAITAGSIANDAITAAKIATGAIDADAIADNAIDAGAIAANAITAAKIADGAIDAATFAADVDAEILSYLVDDATRIDASALNTLSGHDPGETIMGATDLGTGAGLTSLATQTSVSTIDDLLDTEVAAIKTVVDAIQAKTDNLPSDPADASVIAGLIDALPTAAENADAVWEEAIADHSGSAGSTAEQLAAAGAAGDPWATAVPGAYSAGTAGQILGDNLDAAISSRASQTSVDDVDNFVDTEVAAIKAKTDQLTFTTANQVDSRVLTNSDKTGYRLSATGIQDIWDALTSALTTVGSIGKLLVDNINATISSRATQTSVDTVDDFLDTEIAAIKAKTDNLPSDPADASVVAGQITDAQTAIQTDIAALHDFDPTTEDVSVSNIASAAVGDILLEDIANHEGSAGFRTLLGAVSKLVNRVKSNAGTLTIYKTNDSTALGTQTITSDGAAEPIVELDTA